MKKVIISYIVLFILFISCSNKDEDMSKVISFDKSTWIANIEYETSRTQKEAKILCDFLEKIELDMKLTDRSLWSSSDKDKLYKKASILQDCFDILASIQEFEKAGALRKKFIPENHDDLRKTISDYQSKIQKMTGVEEKIYFDEFCPKHSEDNVYIYLNRCAKLKVTTLLLALGSVSEYQLNNL